MLWFGSWELLHGGAGINTGEQEKGKFSTSPEAAVSRQEMLMSVSLTTKFKATWKSNLLFSKMNTASFFLKKRYFGHSKAFLWLQLLQTGISNNISATTDCEREPVPSAAQPVPAAEPAQCRPGAQAAQGRGEGQTEPSTHPSLRTDSCSGCSHPASPCCRHLHCKVEKTSWFSFHTLKTCGHLPERTRQDLVSIHKSCLRNSHDK